MEAVVSLEAVRSRIYLLRGQKVLFDSDLANLYGVTTANLNKAVKRNLERFPADFMFQLTAAETGNLLFQSGTSSRRHGGRRTPPYAFTEQGVAMLSSVLNSDRAVQVNIAIMRAFVQMRELAMSNRELARKLDALEKKHAEHDRQIKVVFEAIRQLVTPVQQPARQIGFKREESESTDEG